MLNRPTFGGHIKLKLFITTLLALLVAGCTLEPIPEPEKEVGKIVTISATIPADTRVSYNDGTGKLAWESGDKLLLAGYDGTTYKGSKIFNWNGGNTFQGEEVTGATSYKAYYPGDIITMDANGNVNPLDAGFWQQTQSGDNTTAHLRNKLLLFDETPNPLNQTFSLALKNSIIRFDLTNVPQEVGTLSHIVWRVETAAGVFKSLPLNVTGVTFSASTNSLNAYLSFDPAAIKIIAGGEYRVALYGEKLSFQSNTVTTEKNYTVGSRYKGTISNWNPAIDWINPLSYFAEHNMANLSNTLEAGHNTSGQYLFTWSDAMKYNTNPATLGNKQYYLPSIEEWEAIIPDDNFFVDFDGTDTRTLNYAAVTVGGENYNMGGTFENIGNVVYATLTYSYQSDPTLYAIARYRTENIGVSYLNARMVIDMQSTVTPYTIDDAKSADWGAVGVVSRVFPAAGLRYDGTLCDQGTYGYYWSSKEYYDGYAGYMRFDSGSAFSGGYSEGYEFSIRLVSR